MARVPWWRALAIVVIGVLVSGTIVAVAVATDRDELPPTAATASTTGPRSTPDPTDAPGSDVRPTDLLPADLPPADAPPPEDPSTSTTTTGPPTTLPTMDVSVVSSTFVDPTRSTQAHGGFPAVAQRRLPTTIWYPTTGGPYPLVVFGAGFANAANDYHDLLHEVAAHGFVVAAPDFPLTSPVSTSAMVESDLSNEPADLSFVATQVLSSSTLAGKVVQGDFATMGHSDGAVVALAAAYNSCCVDSRVGAVVSLSGNTTGFQPAFFPVGSAALLAVHGTADTTNPYANSTAMFARARSPKFLLSVQGGSHEGPFIRDPSRPQIATVVAEFLRGTLQRDATALSRMRDDGNVDGVLSLQTG